MLMESETVKTVSPGNITTMRTYKANVKLCCCPCVQGFLRVWEDKRFAHPKQELNEAEQEERFAQSTEEQQAR